MNAKLAVILVGYNRPESLKRLFKSVVNASSDESVDLIVSIDKSDSQDIVLNVIDTMQWDKGKVVFRTFPERQGLRRHILACGDLTESYEAVVVLEDDIVVSESFLDYVFSAIKFIDDCDDVAGISLYSPLVNEMSLLPFIPKKNGFDNYYLQSAQSWGQCWTRKMWEGFRCWYDSNSEVLIPADDMPSRIYSWPDTSWKKYYMKYLVENNKTFFYSYDSMSTNYSDVGQHNKIITPLFQVPLTHGKSVFKFGTVFESPSYDVFFERLGLHFDGKPVCLDLYGTKLKSTERYFLTSKKIQAPIVYSFGLTYRPQEDNFLNQTPGSDLYLYNLENINSLSFDESYINFKLANYHAVFSWRHALIYSIKTLKLRLIQKIKRL